MIQCQNIKKSFHHHQVLNGITLDFKAGHIHVLLGKSGSGKSTLLHILTQLTPADDGSLAIDHDWIHFPQVTPPKKILPSHPPVGLVFQQHNLWPHMTILKNISLAPLKVLNIDKKTVTQQATNWLNQFNLTDKMHAFPYELSGGEQQRCALIRCLMMPYQAIALDEPTASLDPQSSQDVANALLQLKQQNKLLIISTHDLVFAKSIADSVHYLQEGHIMESGSVDCLHNPQTIALKHFLNQTEETS